MLAGNETSQQTAITIIADYAESGLIAPLVQTYTDAGVTGVTQAIIGQLNLHIASLSREQVDTREEIQAIVDALVTDTTAPVITLNGADPMSVQKGSAFVDPGATALDDKDGSVSVTAQHNVDTQVAGSYTVTYSAMDNAGNTATATRTVGVKENDPGLYFSQSTQDWVDWSTVIILTYKHPGTELEMKNARFIVTGFEAHALYNYSCSNTSWIAPTLSHETDPATGNILTILDIEYGDDDWLDTRFGGETSPVPTCSITLGSTTITDANGDPIPGSAITLTGFVPGQNQIPPSPDGADLPNRADPVDLHVQGWPNTLSMGSVTDNNYGLNDQFAAAKLDSLFKYAGDGFGNRGTVIEPFVSQQTITQARAVAALAGKNVMPTMVVYTANGSGGGVAPEDILDFTNLRPPDLESLTSRSLARISF